MIDTPVNQSVLGGLAFRDTNEVIRHRRDRRMKHAVIRG